MASGFSAETELLWSRMKLKVVMLFLFLVSLHAAKECDAKKSGGSVVRTNLWSLNEAEDTEREGRKQGQRGSEGEKRARERRRER